MFTGYNLKLSRDFFNNNQKIFNEYKKIGKEHLSDNIYEYKNNLNDYINKGTISGSELQNDNFPIIDAEVFISHSHDDTDLANALAGWIHEAFNLRVFVDSNVWSYYPELLADINSNYSNQRENESGGYTYDYEACNNASQHINIMLLVALQKMIDKVECVILLNTDNSITVFDDENKTMHSTYSPWIYSEIVCTQIVRKKPLLYYRKYSELLHANEGMIFEYTLRKLKITYNISLLNLNDLDKADLIRWKDNFINDIFRQYEDYPLDALYCFKHPKELKDAKTLSHHFSCNNIECFKSVVDGNSDSRDIYELFEQVLCECEENNCSICKCKKCKYKSLNE